MTDPLLSVRGLTTRFRTDRGTVTAVDEVSFDVAAGETVAIVGESGSGKSVTALSIMRLIPTPPGKIESGEVLFEGQDLLTLPERALRRVRGRRLAFVPQSAMNALNPLMTVEAQIA
ncbi:MAG TPA: ATP-binding cassette domain-containing protein, partial [Burkholderiaceae bacterium]|nr:ATP-binding cassette domain-containing protein [Burkholderiaceae bacterium]